jgi:hypothetical protein
MAGILRVLSSQQGLRQPDQGQIFIDPGDKFQQRRRRAGYVFILGSRNGLTARQFRPGLIWQFNQVTGL